MSSQQQQQSHNRLSLREEAALRAQQQQTVVHQVRCSNDAPPRRLSSHHPLQDSALSFHQEEQDSLDVTIKNARREWRDFGEGVTQSLEEKRQRGNDTGGGLVVRVISAQERVDRAGSSFIAYVVSVTLPPEKQQASSFMVERRYSDFSKLNALLKKNSIHVNCSFPSKHWAGRMGNWTPSQTWAPQEHNNLVSYRKIQLDHWLVEVCELYNRSNNDLTLEMKTAIWEFLSVTDRQPCDCVNPVEPAAAAGSLSLNRMKWPNPLSFTLGSSIRQATHIVRYMTTNNSKLSESDQSIPLDLLRHAKGLCFLTVAKAGLVVSGRMGTGLVVARQHGKGGWSAPCAVGTVGMGWGALVGGDITHYLVVFTTMEGVETICREASVQLGAEMGVAVGPVGRSASLSARDLTLKPAYAYAHSLGLFAGMSLEGSVLAPRHDVNAKFYGRSITPRELLIEQKQEPPLAGQPLYEALEEALQADIPQHGFRPSQLWNRQQGHSTTASGQSPAFVETGTRHGSPTISRTN